METKTAKKFLGEDEEYERSGVYVLSTDEIVELLNDYFKYRMPSDSEIGKTSSNLLAKQNNYSLMSSRDEQMWIKGAKWLKQLLS